MASTTTDTPADAVVDTSSIDEEDETEESSRTLLDEPPKTATLPLNKENVSVQTSTPLEPPTANKKPRGLSNRPEFPLPATPPRSDEEEEPAINQQEEHPSINQEEEHPSTPRRSELPYLKTPPGTSKILRQHFAKIALTPKRPHIESGAVRIERASTPKRFIASGAVRVEPHVVIPKPIKRTPRRIGYDGTVHTPSRELLKSTACSRSQQIPKPDEQQQQQPISPLSSTPPPSEESVLLDGSMDSNLIPSPAYRQGCENPVAMTLLNDDKEDLDKLLERDLQDQEQNGDDSTIASCPSLMKVSSSLLDVMDQSDVATLARPVPFRVSRSQP